MRSSMAVLVALSLGASVFLTDATAAPHPHATALPVVSQHSGPRVDVALRHLTKPVALVKAHPAPKPHRRHDPKPVRGQGRLVDIQSSPSFEFTEHRRWLSIVSCTTRRDYCKVIDTNPQSANDGLTGYAVGEDLGLVVLTPQQSCIASLSTSILCVYPAHH